MSAQRTDTLTPAAAHDLASPHAMCLALVVLVVARYHGEVDSGVDRRQKRAASFRERPVLSRGWCDPQRGFLPVDDTSRMRPRTSWAAVPCELTAPSFRPNASPFANASRRSRAWSVPARVYFVACARDAARKLKRYMLPQLELLASSFAEHESVFLENDSTDDTRDVLLKWANERPNALRRTAGGARSLLLLQGTQLKRLRTERVALCRNTLLRFVRERERQRVSTAAARGARGQRELPAFLVVLDIDCKRPVGAAPLARAVTSMLASRQWDVLTANSIAGQDYYDLWALRSRKLCLQHDCWHDRASVRRRGNCDAYEVRLDHAAPTFEVLSAFNGLAVYRLATVAHGGAGRGTDGSGVCLYDGSVTCEHVAFHKCLHGQGLRLAVAPYLVQGCGNGAPRPPPPSVTVRMLADGSVVIGHNQSLTITCTARRLQYN